jgi:hypothetical protein
MAEIKGWMSLLFLLDNSKSEPMEAAMLGKRKLPKEKRDILKSLAEEELLICKAAPHLGEKTRK